MTSIHGNVYSIQLCHEIEKCVSNWLQPFLIDFRKIFNVHKECEIQVLRYENASELNSAEVQQLQLETGPGVDIQ
jgi:hypothetical protein